MAGMELGRAGASPLSAGLRPTADGAPPLPFLVAPRTAHRWGAFGLAGVAVVWLVAAVSTGETDGTTLAGFLATLGVIAACLGLLLTGQVETQRSLLVWPVAGNVLLLMASWSDPSAAPLCLSTITIAYVAVGITQPRWTSLGILPLSILVTWATLDLPADQAAVRILIACCVWMTVAELPAWLIDQLRAARALMSHMADTDALTGLANRRAWDARFAELTARSRAVGRPVSVKLIDLDHFKRYNDAHGHLAGDDLLIRFGRRLRDVVRSGDLVARWGGEEFAVALHDCDLARATTVADRIRAGIPGEITCSVGLTAYVTDELAAATLSRADTALYRAKQEGRHCVRVA